MRNPLIFLIAVSLIIRICAKTDSLEVLPRDPFNIHLANLSLSTNEKNGACEKVRIKYADSKDQVVITPLDDMYIKYSRNGSEKITYRENINDAYIISSFEAQQLILVSKSLLATLEQFEKYLHDREWGKCLYLDSFLPRFLKGYYYLINIAQCSSDALPESAKVADSLFDISLNSLKSDNRIRKWQLTQDSLVKLRIATKELIYQIRAWQQETSKKGKNNAEIQISKDFAHSLGLFVSIYFNETLRLNKSSSKR